MKGRKGKYEPGTTQPYELSRSKVELFASCPRCFWLDRRALVAPPGPAPYTLNAAVDELLKREFDGYRAAQVVPPLLARNGLALRPAPRPELADWRNAFKGVRVLHAPTNLLVYGAIDDLWIDAGGTYYVADYKATSKNGSVGIDAAWQKSYKRQLEFYQWLLRGRGLTVSPQGWFVYANARKDRDAFDQVLHFDVSLIPYKGDTAWVEPMLAEIHGVLNADRPPACAPDCELCAFVSRASGY
jgi:RecB family exonuclease